MTSEHQNASSIISESRLSFALIVIGGGLLLVWLAARKRGALAKAVSTAVAPPPLLVSPWRPLP